MRFLIFFSVIALLAGCSDFNDFYGSRTNGRGRKGAGPEVVAVVGSDEITTDDLMKALERLPYNQKKTYLSSPEKMSELLDTYINQKVLYTEAVRRGIDRRKDVVEKTENFRKQVIGQTFGQEILKTLKVSDNEIEDYYGQHKNEYEQIGVSEIFIKSDPENGITNEAALAEAQEVSERAKAGEDWEELVKRFPDGVPGNKKAGKAEFIERGKFGAEIDERLFKMQRGEITDPLEVDGGYYIIKIEDGAQFPPEGQIKRKIESRLINEKLVKYVYSLRDEIGVEVYRDRLEESVHSE